MEKDKGSTLKSISTTIPYRGKQALIMGGILVLVVLVISTIAAVISKQGSNGKYISKALDNLLPFFSSGPSDMNLFY